MTERVQASEEDRRVGGLTRMQVQLLEAFVIAALQGDEGKLADANFYLPVQDAVNDALAALSAPAPTREGEAHARHGCTCGRDQPGELLP